MRPNNSRAISLLTETHLLADFIPFFIKELEDRPDVSIRSFFDSYLSRLDIGPRDVNDVLQTKAFEIAIFYLTIAPFRDWSLDLPITQEVRKCSIRDLNPKIWGTVRLEHLSNSTVDLYDESLSYLIRRLRNALAHFRFTFQGEFIHFEDLNPGVPDDHIRMSFTREDIHKFICEIPRNIDWESIQSM